jgi:carbamoylphosphate synthase small subunit
MLVLSDGTVFQGVGIGAEGMEVGEVVFNTSMTGYQEILTDPVLLPADRHPDLSAHRQRRHQ